MSEMQSAIPDHIETFFQAQAAWKSGETDRARELARRLIDCFPDHPHGYVADAETSMTLLDYDGAERSLATGLERCAAKAPLLIARASVAALRKDWAQSLCRWGDVLSFEPGQPRGLLGLVEAHTALGDLVAADEVLVKLRAAYPLNYPIAIRWARLALDRGDWADALHRWSTLRELYPDSEDVRRGFGLAREQWNLESASQFGGTEGVAAAPPIRAPVTTTANAEIRDLLLEFESVGVNCEFGLVQRKFEAEPLDLLRWGFAQHESLLRLLVTRFASLEGPDSIRLMTHPQVDEWFVLDEVSKVTWHTFTRPGACDPEIFLGKQLRRLHWLRRQMIGKLENAEKIFVYCTGRSAIGIDDIERLHRAIRAYGSSTLLWVSVAQAGETPGAVEVLADGLMHGVIGKDGKMPNQPFNIAFDDWIAVCRHARAHRLKSLKRRTTKVDRGRVGDTRRAQRQPLGTAGG